MWVCNNCPDLYAWAATILVGGEDLLASSTIRLIARAAVLAVALLIVGAGVAFADPNDASTAGPDSASTGSKAKAHKSGPDVRDSSNPDRPTSALGNGRENVDVAPSGEGKNKGDFPPATTKFSGSITIPIPRIPEQDQLPASGLPSPALFFTTVVIRVPTLGDFFAALQPKPTPAPTPAPALRAQEKMPAVVDSGGGGGGGGGGADPLSVAAAGEPQVLHAPMVIAPVPVAISAVLPAVDPLDVAARAGANQGVPAEAASAGANAPMIRGSLPPSVEPATKLLTPTNGRTTRAGYSRYVRNPTSVELAVVALPGLAGLLFVTFGGGFIGYRQANSVRFLRVHGDGRFLR